MKRIASITMALLLAGCAAGPKYQRPVVQVPAAYKEPPPEAYKESQGWKSAQPADTLLRGDWWNWETGGAVGRGGGPALMIWPVTASNWAILPADSTMPTGLPLAIRNSTHLKGTPPTVIRADCITRDSMPCTSAPCGNA